MIFPSKITGSYCELQNVAPDFCWGFFCEKFPPFSQEPWQDMKFILVAATLPATATPLEVAKRPSDATGECLLGYHLVI